MPTTASDIMTAALITVTPATPISEFARICSEDGVSGAPVVQVDGKLVGVVSKTDIITRLLDEDPRWGTSEAGLHTLGEDLRQVQDIMNEAVLTVGPDTPIAEIAQRMATDRVHRVLVMEEDKLVGIVTSIDLLAHFP